MKRRRIVLDETSPIATIGAALRSDYLDIVISRAAAQARMTNTPRSKKLIEAVNKHVRLNGYIRPAEALKNASKQLLDAIAKAALHQPPLFDALLAVWIESHESLRDDVQTFLVEHNLPSNPTLQRSINLPQSSIEVTQLISQLLGTNTNKDRDDLLLMATCLSGMLFVPLENEADDMLSGDQMEIEKTMTAVVPDKQFLTTFWARLFDVAQEVEADDQGWEHDAVNQFVASIQRLAEEKLLYRNIGRQLLAQALASLAAQPAELRRSFDVDVSLDWQIDRVPRTEATALAHAVNHLVVALESFQTVESRRPNSFAERQQRKSDLEVCEANVVEALNRARAGLARMAADSGPILDPPEPYFPPSLLGHEEADQSSAEAHPIAATQASAVSGGAPENVSYKDENEPLSFERPGERPEADQASDTDLYAVNFTADPSQSLGIRSIDAPLIPANTPEIAAFQLVSDPPDDVDSRLGGTDDQLLDTRSVGIGAIAEDLQVLDHEASEESVVALSGATIVTPESEEALMEYEPATLVYELLAEQDGAAAYWVARASAQVTNIPPPWLLAAVQAEAWLPIRGDVSTEIDGELFVLAQEATEPANEAEALLQLAAAIRLALIAPRAGFGSWLRVPADPVLADLAKAVADFAELGIDLTAGLTEGMADTSGSKEQQVVRDAQRWLDESPHRTTNYGPATDVWRDLIGPKGALHALLFSVANNDRSDVEGMRERIEQWQVRSYAAREIDAIVRRRNRGSKAQAIEGIAQDQLVRLINEGCAIAARWLAASEQTGGAVTQGKAWQQAQIDVLRRRWDQLLPPVEALLGELQSNGSLAKQVAAGCLGHTLERTSQLFRAENTTNRHDERWVTKILDAAPSVSQMLAWRLVWHPEIELDDQAQPDAGSLERIGAILAAARHAIDTPATVAERWGQKRDFRFLDVLEQAMDEAEAERVQRMLQTGRRGAIAALKDDLTATTNAVELAYYDGVIDDVTRARLGARTDAIDPAETLNFVPAFRVLKSIRQELEQARDERLANYVTQWRVLEQQLAGLDVTEIEELQLLALVQVTIDRQDIRALEEALDRVQRRLSGEPVNVRAEHQTMTTFDGDQQIFLNTWPDLVAALTKDRARLIDAVKAGEQFAGCDWSRRAEEALRVLNHWQQWTQQTGKHNERALLSILSFVGFQPEHVDETMPQTAKAPWVHARIRMHADPALMRPIPQFGTLAERRYDIVCIWVGELLEPLGSLLRRVSPPANQRILLVFGPLTTQQRRDIQKFSKDNAVTLAALDETLLVFLAQYPAREDRMALWLRCSLPFSVAKPYTPERPGDVPSEMFYGRQEAIQTLKDPSGSCLVYGGRQLGKSALLREVERQFERQGPLHRAWVEDIKFVGEAHQPPGTIWRRIREVLCNQLAVLSKNTKNESSELASNIQRYLDKEPTAHILLMFDEADNFLDADGSDNFRVVDQLRNLMTMTQRRFKVVFAGLHNVQRFAGIPNQPLAHFGTPVLVGPLGQHAAQALIQEPLHALGFRLDPTSDVLRILSFTNYHAGLIQIYCDDLLKNLHRMQRHELPPYQITPDEIDAAYLRIRSKIRERFELTISLDDRYKAIALVLIIDAKGHSRQQPGHHAADILTLLIGWWPQSFAAMPEEELRGLLDELVGLGILVRSADGSYLLRSPNIVRMFGSERDIELVGVTVGVRVGDAVFVRLMVGDTVLSGVRVGNSVTVGVIVGLAAVAVTGSWIPSTSACWAIRSIHGWICSSPIRGSSSPIGCDTRASRPATGGDAFPAVLNQKWFSVTMIGSPSVRRSMSRIGITCAALCLSGSS